MGTYIHNNPVCVCAYPRVQFPSRLILMPYLLSKTRHCRVERTTKEPASEVLRTHTHRHTGLLCIYVPPTNSMTTCRPAFVLLLFYALNTVTQATLERFDEVYYVLYFILYFK